jgi:ATP-binding cassette subfamily C protein CydD
MGPAAHSATTALRKDDFADQRELPVVAVPIRSQKKADNNAPSGRPAAIVQTFAALLWLPQAAFLAKAVGMIVAGNIANIHWMVAAVIAIGVIRALVDAAGGRLAFRTARTILSLKRDEAIAALCRRSPLDIVRPASGLAASVLAEQAETILPYLARFRPARMKATVVPVIILLCVFPISWVAAIVLLISAPLIPLFMALIGWRAKAASEKHLGEMGELNSFLLDRLRGLATIRSLGAVDLTASRLRANADELRVRTMAVLRIAFLSSAVLELFAALGVAMVAVYIGFHFLGQLNFGAWGQRLSLSEGLFILLLAPAFFEPLRELSSVWHDRAAGEAAIDALEKLSVTGVAMPGGPDAGDLSPRLSGVAQRICVQGLSFHHAGNSSLVLKNFNLAVAPGEHVALLGPSGSGKSTLLALIAGLASSCEGWIEIGGVRLEPRNATALRRHMAWVGQKPHIFAGTISENIALERSGIGPAEIQAALNIAVLGDVANAQGHRQIGEGGCGLSGGEVLRLALARAAADPLKGIILADEPTAHLDATTASGIMDSLIVVAAGKTLIVATHDPILARRMDRVLILPQVPEHV